MEDKVDPLRCGLILVGPAILRQNGATALSQVEPAVLEVTGDVSVILNDSPRVRTVL